MAGVHWWREREGMFQAEGTARAELDSKRMWVRSGEELSVSGVGTRWEDPALPWEMISLAKQDQAWASIYKEDLPGKPGYGRD